MKKTNLLFVITLFLFFSFGSVKQVSASTIYYPHTNHQGSVVMVTDESGEVVEDSRYYAYGDNRTPDTTYQPPVTERAYTGQIKDASSDIYYYNARYYDPDIGTFISGDTLGSGNRFGYVSGNPISLVDPSGNRDIECGPGECSSPDSPPIEIGINIPPPTGVVGSNTLTIDTDSFLMPNDFTITPAGEYLAVRNDEIYQQMLSEINELDRLDVYYTSKPYVDWLIGSNVKAYYRRGIKVFGVVLFRPKMYLVEPQEPEPEFEYSRFVHEMQHYAHNQYATNIIENITKKGFDVNLFQEEISAYNAQADYFRSIGDIDNELYTRAYALAFIELAEQMGGNEDAHGVYVDFTKNNNFLFRETKDRIYNQLNDILDQSSINDFSPEAIRARN